MTGPPSLMVTQESACQIGLGDNFHRQFPLDTDHSGLVKFSTQWDDAYQRVMSIIKELAVNAPKVVDRRFRLIEGVPRANVTHLSNVPC